jgi:HK97 family phage prohead protease
VIDKHQKSVEDMAMMADPGGFRGYAARFLNIDRQRDIILPGAFAKALPAFMDDGGMVLADHQNRTGAVIGTMVDAREDRSGVLVDVRFSSTTPAQEVRRLMAEKAVRKMSIAFWASSKPYTEKQIHQVWDTFNHIPSDSQRAMAKQGAKVIADVAEIMEVSVVPIPANPGAEIIAVKSFDEENTSLSVAPRIDLKALLERAAIAERILGR